MRGIGYQFGKYRAHVAWLLLLLWLAVSGFLSSDSPARRVLFADQSTHIAAALSIWHDGDLQYTLDDLARFREFVPSAPGPVGMFLKVGDGGQLFFAKPIAYPFFAAPFVGAIGLDGFWLFNIVCLGAIGVVALIVLTPQLGELNALFLSGGFFLLSPFLAWTPIAHPDLFIATLLIVGGYAFLKVGSSPTVAALGAALLGLALHEKPTLVFMVVPMVMAQLGLIPRHRVVTLGLIICFAWLAPAIVNVLQDGNMIVYKGHRFYVSGSEGAFPLETGWSGPPVSGGMDYVFSLNRVFGSLSANVSLLPQKLSEALLGRQTGVLLYFPSALLTLVLLAPLASWRGTLLLGGFFSYLVLNWLVFPTNGYGGAGSYGSRYLMQAIGVILLVAMPQCSRAAWKPLAQGRIGVAIVMALGLSLILQVRVIPPQPNLVGTPEWIFRSPIAAMFPIEGSLAPTIAMIAPPSFSSINGSGSAIYFVEGEPPPHFHLDFQPGAGNRAVVLYQSPIARSTVPSFPEFEVAATRPLVLEFLADGKVVGRSEALPGISKTVRLDGIFTRTYFDALYGPYHMRRITVRAQPLGESHADIPSWVTLCFPATQIQDMCRRIDTIDQGGLGRRGDAKLITGWYRAESWGVWSRGPYAALLVTPTGLGSTLEVILTVHALTHLRAPTMRVDVFANGAYLETWNFLYKEQNQPRKLRIPFGLIEKGAPVIIGLRIYEPRSPVSLGLSGDGRLLGVGLTNVSWSWID